MGIRDWFKTEPEQEKPNKDKPKLPMSHEQYVRRAAQLHDHNYTRGWKPQEVSTARQELARAYYNQPEVKAAEEENRRKHEEYNRRFVEMRRAQEAKLTEEELAAKRARDLEEAKQFAKKKKTK